MTQPVNQQWLLASRPEGRIKESDFEWKESALPEPGDGELLLRNIYLSLDPAGRGWMNDARSYIPPVGIGEVMRGGTVGVVEASNHPNFAVGDYVSSGIGWQAYQLSDGRGLTKIAPNPAIPLDAYIGLFNHIGFTAYFGLLDIGEPKEGETLVVSAAAGAVGSLVGQIGKIKGCRVIGIAGTDEKCAWLTDELGFDGAINYKTENVRKALKTHCPDGIDIYFENVGGKILDAVLTRVNVGARIPLCGLISTYNATEPVPGPYNFASLLVNRVKLQGFIVFDYVKRYGEAIADLGQWLMEGKLQYRVHMVEGLENAPEAMNMLFDGKNTGKLVIQVSEA